MVRDIRAMGPAFAQIDRPSGLPKWIEQARYLQTANVAMAGRPAKAVRSRLLDGRPQPAERGAEIFVRDLGETGRDALRRFGIAGALRRLLATAKRGLPQPQSSDPLPADEAISAPTMSAQRVTSSVEAKPCLANASVSVLCRRSASGRGTDLPGLFMLQGSATSIGHDASRWDEAAKARVAARGPARR